MAEYLHNCLNIKIISMNCKSQKMHKWLPSKDKLSIINSIITGIISRKDVAKKYNLLKSTVSMILKNTENTF